LLIRIKFILTVKIVQKYYLNRLLPVGISIHTEMKFWTKSELSFSCCCGRI